MAGTPPAPLPTGLALASPPARPPLTTITVRGLFWNYLSLVVTKAGALIITVVAARMLGPQEFGSVALATVAVELLGVMKDFGIGLAMIRHDQESTIRDTAFTLNLAGGALLTAISVVGAGWFAAWAGEPAVTDFIRVLGLTFLLEALGAIHLVRLRRRLSFKRKLGVDFARAAVKLVVAVGGVLAGFGAWALVASAVAAPAASSVMAWALLPWRPRLRLDTSQARELFQYGGPLAIADGVAQVQTRVEMLAVGTVFGAPALGLYTVADRAPGLMGGSVLWVTSGVLLPAYARIRDDRPRLREAVIDTLRFSSMVYVPITLGLALTARPLLGTFFGEPWVPAAPILAVLAIAALCGSLVFHFGDVLRVLSQTRPVLALAALDFAVFAVAGAVAARRFGPVGIAFARLFATLVTGGARTVISLRVLQMPLTEMLRALMPSAAGAVALAAAVLLAQQVALDGHAARLSADVAIGAVTYAAVLWLVDRRGLRSVLGRARSAVPVLSANGRADG
jgi:O-antigen/teichoic acid export membrane protein